MKKLLALLLCAILAFTALCACESSKKSSDDDDDEDESVESSENVSDESSEDESSEDESSEDESSEDESSEDESSEDESSENESSEDESSESDKNGNDEIDTALVGTWECEIDLVDWMMGSDVHYEDEEVRIPMVISFEFDKTEVCASIGLTQNAEDLATMLIVLDYLEYIETEDVTPEEFLELIDPNEYLGSAEALIESNQVSIEGSYTLVGDKLIFEYGEFTIELDEDEFTITEMSDEMINESGSEFFLNQTFKKVS